ncbi:MAG: hypothetical protein ACFFBD_18630 [Candidatus Hodarchaeota archaeon]
MVIYNANGTSVYLTTTCKKVAIDTTCPQIKTISLIWDLLVNLGVHLLPLWKNALFELLLIILMDMQTRLRMLFQYSFFKTN